jgi:hypothetical protein
MTDSMEAVMGQAIPYNFELAEIITDAVETGSIGVGSKEHQVALRVAYQGLRSLDEEDRMVFDLFALPALLKSTPGPAKPN